MYAKRAIKKSPKLTKLVNGVILATIDVSGYMHVDPYQAWVAQNFPDPITMLSHEKAAADFAYKPLISVLTPTCNTNPAFLFECIDSVRAQSYPHWEMCIVDDASTDEEVRALITRLAAEDQRIRYAFRETRGHISTASNDALAIAEGEFMALLDHDDLLWPNALYEAAKALNINSSLDFLFSDEEKTSSNRWDHRDPLFKPDWNPEFMESLNAVTHLAVIRTDLARRVGGFRPDYDGAQDWDLFFRVSAETRNIHHIPTVLYSWRMSESSTASSSATKPYIAAAQRAAIEDSLIARGFGNAVVTPGVVPDYWTVTHPVVGQPKVSIVVPTRNQFRVLKRCLDSILKKTTYPNFEIVLVDTGSRPRTLLDWYTTPATRAARISILDWLEQPFSFSRACNHGAAGSEGEYLVFLNNDTEVLTPDWLDLMLGDAQRDGIGAVGCKLLYPGGTIIQHAGIGIGIGGSAANLLSGVREKSMTPMQSVYGNTRHAVSAVTAACMMIRRDRFDEIGGFDDEFRVTYNDVDLCLRLTKAGYRNIYNPSVRLLHHESISVGRPEDTKRRDTEEFEQATALFKTRWREFVDNDPNLNPNLDRTTASFEPLGDEPKPGD